MPKARPQQLLERLGRRLRARRIYMKLPLAYTARQMGFTPSMLTDYENGKAHPPCFTLARMAAVLGTTSSVLMNERQPGNREDIDRALELMAVPAIAEVANVMRRMDRQQRQRAVEVLQRVELML